MASSFQIKSWVSVVAGMINYVRGVQAAITDFNIGAVARTMLEAVATEIEELYRQMFDGLRAAIPVATYTSFNFDRLEAAPATGLITVTVSVSAQDVVIPAGTVFTTPGSRISYISQDPVVIPNGSATGVVSVVASAPGSAGNLPASTSFAVSPLITNFTSASNATLFNSGRDLEQDEERKQRFEAFISTLPRGTLAALDYGSRQAARYNTAGVEIERVRAVGLIEPYLDDNTQPIAWVKVYVHNGVGATSGQLVDEVSRVLHGYTNSDGVKVAGWKAAGVKVDVFSSFEVNMNLVARVTAAVGYDVGDLLPLVNDVLEKYLLGLDNGEPFILSRAVVLSSEIDGVANIVFDIASTDPRYAASVSANTPGAGNKTFAVPSGKSFAADQLVRIFGRTDRSKYMEGVVNSYSGTSLVVAVKAFGGTVGADWVIGPVDPGDAAVTKAQKFMPGAIELVAA